MNDKLKSALSYLLDRLSENSTWRGIVLGLTGIGIAISPDQAAKITAIGLGIVGVINILRQGSPTKAQVSDALSTKLDKVPPPAVT
jgi:hypothetical protein